MGLKFKILRDPPGWPAGSIELRVYDGTYTSHYVLERQWPFRAMLDAYRGLRQTHLAHVSGK